MIVHVLKDGTQTESLQDKVISREDSEIVYRLIEEINNGDLYDEKHSN